MHLARMTDACERQEHLHLRPDLEPPRSGGTRLQAPVGEIRHTVQIPEQKPVREEEEERIPPHRRTVGKHSKPPLRLCRANGRKKRCQHLGKRLPAQRRTLKRAEDAPVEPEFPRHMSERGELTLRARIERHRHRQVEHEEDERQRPRAARKNRP